MRIIIKKDALRNKEIFIDKTNLVSMQLTSQLNILLMAFKGYCF